MLALSVLFLDRNERRYALAIFAILLHEWREYMSCNLELCLLSHNQQPLGRKKTNLRRMNADTVGLLTKKQNVGGDLMSGNFSNQR